MILRFRDRYKRLTLALIVVFLSLAHLRWPTPTLLPLDFENDVAQPAPGRTGLGG